MAMWKQRLCVSTGEEIFQAPLLYWLINIKVSKRNNDMYTVDDACSTLLWYINIFTRYMETFVWETHIEFIISSSELKYGNRLKIVPYNSTVIGWEEFIHKLLLWCLLWFTTDTNSPSKCFLQESSLILWFENIFTA